MSKYAKLDAAILSKIGRTPVFFTRIFTAPDVHQECRRLVEAEGSSISPFRILDRRLQALRRAGEIIYAKGAKGGWLRVQKFSVAKAGEL